MENKLATNKIILGLMRLKNVTIEELEELIKESIDLGITYFDLSDIYGRGESEEKFGEVMKRNPSLRNKIIIQTKCGIIKNDNEGYALYDLSYEHIIEACNASLKRLNIDYLDVLLLHRPDILMDSKEINKAIKQLFDEGKIKHFGVSNFSSTAIEYLRKDMQIPVEIDQLQLGLGSLNLIKQEMNINLTNEESISRDNGTYFYLKKNNMLLQTWSPYQVGFFGGSIFKDEKYKKTNKLLEDLAKKYNTSPCAIATSFLLMLGENIQVITGSTNIEHVKQSYDGTKIKLTKIEWYKLYCSTGNMLP